MYYDNNDYKPFNTTSDASDIVDCSAESIIFSAVGTAVFYLIAITAADCGKKLVHLVGDYLYPCHNFEDMFE